VTAQSVAAWRVRGEPLVPATGTGPLDGLRVAVKDLFAVEGFAVGAGNPAWLADAPVSTSDAAAVAALRAAGARVAGIAHTDELAFALSGVNVHYGTPANPAAPDLVPGGSSSGPAAAVALGEADVGLGTDTGGSIRVPASCCGLFGLRPTFGAVPQAGVLSLAPSFDTVGWLTRDAATLRLVGDVLLDGRSNGLGAPRRVLLVTEPEPGGAGLSGTDAAGAAGAAGAVSAVGAVSAAVRRAARIWGASVHPIPWPGDAMALLAAFRCVQAAEAWRLHGAWIEAHPDTLAPDIAGRFRFGSTVDGRAEATARAMLAAWRDRLVDLLGTDTWLALPAAGGPGHPRADTPAVRDAWRQATLWCSVPASACGLPSVSVPTGASPPLGVAFIGPPGADLALLDATVALGDDPAQSR
jgi:amidase